MAEKQSATDSRASRAQEFQRAFTAGAERRLETLARLLEGATRRGVVLVMMSNGGYNDLFDNWVRSCDQSGLEVRSWSVLFAADPQAAANAQRQGFRTFLDEASYGKQPAHAVKEFGNRDFARLMFQKTAVVQDVLSLGHDVLFQDVDVVWRKDPLPLLLSESGESFDARFMFDGFNPRHAPLHANVGFFLLRNRPVTRAFWAKALSSYDEMERAGRQQPTINRLLAGEAIRVDILREADFANGHLFSIDSPSLLPPDPYVIHCSWTGNREHKLEKYRRAGLWYL